MKKVGEAKSVLSIDSIPLSSSDSKVIVNAVATLLWGKPISKKSTVVSFPVLDNAIVWFEFENPVIIYLAERVVLVPSPIAVPSFLDIDIKSLQSRKLQ